MREANGREYMLRVRMSDEEREMLEALAARDGLTSSDVVRLLVRRTYADTFGDQKPKRKKR